MKNRERGYRPHVLTSSRIFWLWEPQKTVKEWKSAQDARGRLAHWLTRPDLHYSNCRCKLVKTPDPDVLNAPLIRFTRDAHIRATLQEDIELIFRRHGASFRAVPTRFTIENRFNKPGGVIVGKIRSASMNPDGTVSFLWEEDN